MRTSRLATLIGTTLRHERQARSLTQQALAERAGTSQAAVTRIERGDRIPSIAMVERLFIALGTQLTIAVEPLDAHLDARLDELAERSLAERIEDAAIDDAVDRLDDLPYVLIGGTAALLQGVPVHRWQTIVGEIRASMCEELPTSIGVRHGERSYRVVPLIQLELTDPRAADLLRRYRKRQAGHDDPTPRAGHGGRAEGTG